MPGEGRASLLTPEPHATRAQPGNQCSAAAALGMAYFFVLKHQNSFDVRWCKGNVGEKIFQPWVQQMQQRGVTFRQATRATGFVTAAQRQAVAAGDDAPPAAAAAGSPGAELVAVECTGEGGEKETLEADVVVFAVGAAALAAMVRGSPELARHAEARRARLARPPFALRPALHPDRDRAVRLAQWRRYGRLRGTGVLATRLYLDRAVPTPHTANACWGFDAGVGMTWFDIGKLHELQGACPPHPPSPRALAPPPLLPLLPRCLACRRFEPPASRSRRHRAPPRDPCRRAG